MHQIKTLHQKDIENLSCFKDFHDFQKRILTKRNNLRVIQEAIIYWQKNKLLPQKLGSSNMIICQELINNLNQENNANGV